MMILVFVAADVAESALKLAAQELDLPYTPSKSGVIRVALALAAGKSLDEAKEYAGTGNKANLESGKQQVGAQAPPELVELADQRYPKNRAYAIRVGVAMTTGASREVCEQWASLIHAGRPAGSKNKSKTIQQSVA